MKKADCLIAWKSLPDNMPIMKHFEAIPYKAKGSTYGACGVRIDGNPAFIDAVLSRLKDLIDGENHVTRLTLARNVVDGAGIGKVLDNTAKDAECCYIRSHQRGNEGAIASSIFDKHLNGATNRYLTA